MKLHDTVALIKPIDHTKIVVGQVGTIVADFDGKAFEVEFADKDGFTIDMLTLDKSNLMVLYFEEARA